MDSSHTCIAKPTPLVVKVSRRSYSADDSDVAPPAYGTVDPPSYSKADTSAPEPRTLPMYLFFLGFVCPLLWVVGTFTMRLPHRERRGALDPFAMARLPEMEKAAADREVERIMKRWEVEMKWGK
ncbi:hypothetical protein DXG01_009583, partial [Tephrocybe rancida]